MMAMTTIPKAVLRNLLKNRYNLKICHLRDASSSSSISPNGSTGINNTEGKFTKFKKGPDLNHFIANANIKIKNTKTDVYLNHTVNEKGQSVPYIQEDVISGKGRKVFFDVYGCQMNVNDTDIVWSILRDHGYEKCSSLYDADIVLVVTCAIREGAEQKVWNKIELLKGLKKGRLRNKGQVPLQIAVLGCMAERLKHQLLEREKAVDVVCGPDAYRDLPRLLAVGDGSQPSINVALSLEETYADITPVRLNSDSVSAFVSIMRGCDNMCSYCIVPFTRGRERSRPVNSILDEVRCLSDLGVREVTLLGQNVNSYRDTSETTSYTHETHLTPGFKTVYKPKKGGLRFADLLESVSQIDPEMRIRFTSPHPKDFPDEVLYCIRDIPNICNSLHLPAQSGNTEVLQNMRRGYSREAYIDLVNRVRELIPGVSLSSDFIAGFCGETDEQFEETLSLIKLVQYNSAFLFPYSMRERTHAHRKMTDDVPQSVKLERLRRMITAFRSGAEQLNQSLVGSRQLVLVEGASKRSSLYLAGRSDGNTRVILPGGEIAEGPMTDTLKAIKPGDYVAVLVNWANSQVLKGIPLYHTSLSEFYQDSSYTPTKPQVIESGYC